MVWKLHVKCLKRIAVVQVAPHKSAFSSDGFSVYGPGQSSKPEKGAFTAGPYLSEDDDLHCPVDVKAHTRNVHWKPCLGTGMAMTALKPLTFSEQDTVERQV